MDSAIILGVLVVLVAIYFHRRSQRDKDDGVDPPNPVTNVKLEIKER
jgi:heme/copper-type cytochrome/quinol oxidase subunit 2